MKKIYFIMTYIALILACLFLAACGGQKDSGESTWRGIQAGTEDLSAITDRTEYYDLFTEQKPIFQWEQEQENSPLSIKRAKFNSMQFYQGEPVQLWEMPNLDQYGLLQSWDLCLYRPDGSREVLLSEISIKYPHHGYLDQEGNLYWWHNSTIVKYPSGSIETINASLEKRLPSGEVLFDKQLDPGLDILNIRQAADGRVYLLMRDREIKSAEFRWLAELDPVTGLITELETGRLTENITASLDLGIHGGKPVLLKLTDNMITEINTDDKTESVFLSFWGTSYTAPKNYPSLRDFRILEDESMEFLWTAGDGSKSICEKLWIAEVEKIPIVLRARGIGDWLPRQISSFNQSNETYYVIVEDCGPGNDPEDFARLTSVQIASGKGPDILYGRLMQDYVSGMIEKGSLEDLRPYMEKSGIREDDYFPFTFGTWRDGDKIFGVTPTTPGLTGYLMDSSVLGGTEEPDIEMLVDGLLAKQESAAFLKGYDSQELLAVLLKGTETLWGMVDWEKGSCDFDGELFAKILETAKRYGDNGGSEEKTYIASPRFFTNIFLFDSISDRKRDGKVICGLLFDDGCHTAFTSNSALAINANSLNKEGAWEFISFLLGDEAQSVRNNVPASRKLFDVWVAEQKERVADGKEVYGTFYGENGVKTMLTFTEDDITDELVEEFVKTLEDARPYPLRTVPILEIISEEAADYFNGSKSAAEVGKVVTNRVQLYLDEEH